jgi:hypothetical protein
MSQPDAGFLDLTADSLKDNLKENKHIDESILGSLFTKLAEIIDREPNILYLGSPLTVCGDIHG